MRNRAMKWNNKHKQQQQQQCVHSTHALDAIDDMKRLPQKRAAKDEKIRTAHDERKDCEEFPQAYEYFVLWFIFLAII